MLNWLKEKRERFLNQHHHAIHRSEQLAHIILYTSLATGFKDVYVAMGGVVAIVIVVNLFADTEA